MSDQGPVSSSLFFLYGYNLQSLWYFLLFDKCIFHNIKVFFQVHKNNLIWKERNKVRNTRIKGIKSLSGWSCSPSSPVSNIYQQLNISLMFQDTSGLEAGTRGGLLSWLRLLNYMWAFAHLPLNQGSLTGDRSKSWIGRCSVSAR